MQQISGLPDFKGRGRCGTMVDIKSNSGGSSQGIHVGNRHILQSFHNYMKNMMRERKKWSHY